MAEILATPGTTLAPALGLEAKIEFNGLVLHDIQAVDGRIKPDRFHLDAPPSLRKSEVRDARQINPSRDGETALIARRGGRTITLTGTIHAGNISKLRDLEAALDDATDDMLERPLIFTAPAGKGRSVLIYCRVTDKDVTDQVNSTKIQSKFQITFRASQPKYLSTSTKTFTRGYYDYDDLSTTPVETRFTYVPTTIPGVNNYSYSAGTVSFPGAAPRTQYRRTRPNWSHRPLITASITLPTLATFTAGRRFGIYALGDTPLASYVYGVLENSGGTIRLAIYNRNAGTETLIASTPFTYPSAGGQYDMQFKPRAPIDPTWGSRLFLCLTPSALTRDVSLDGTPPATSVIYNVGDEGETTSTKDEYGIINEGTGGTFVLRYWKMNPMNVTDNGFTVTNDGTGQADAAVTLTGAIDSTLSGGTTRAALIERLAPRNLVRNPSFENDPIGTALPLDWVTYLGFAVTTQVVSGGIRGYKSMRMDFPANVPGSGAGVQIPMTVYIGDRFTAYIDLKGAVGGEQVTILLSTGGVNQTTLNATLTTSWQRFSLPLTSVVNNAFLSFYVVNTFGPNLPAQTIFIDGMQIVYGSTGFPNYFDGSLSGSRWSGTPFASPSDVDYDPYQRGYLDVAGALGAAGVADIYIYDSRDGRFVNSAGVNQYDKIRAARKIALYGGDNRIALTTGRINNTVSFQQTALSVIWQDTWK